MDILWTGVYVAAIVGVLIVVVGVLLGICESKYRPSLEKKDRAIRVLSEQLKIAKEHEEARKLAAKVSSDASDAELKALALVAGRPILLETFLYLTNNVSIGFEWNPLKDPPQWDTEERPTHKEIERIAAVRVLRDRDYVSGAMDSGFGGYAIVASNEAMAVKSAHDRLPNPLKEKVREPQDRP